MNSIPFMRDHIRTPLTTIGKKVYQQTGYAAIVNADEWCGIQLFSHGNMQCFIGPRKHTETQKLVLKCSFRVKPKRQCRSQYPVSSSN